MKKSLISVALMLPACVPSGGGGGGYYELGDRCPVQLSPDVEHIYSDLLAIVADVECVDGEKSYRAPYEVTCTADPVIYDLGVVYVENRQIWPEARIFLAYEDKKAMTCSEDENGEMIITSLYTLCEDDYHWWSPVPCDF